MHILECLVFGEWPRDTRFDPVTEKVCPTCMEVKPVSEFGTMDDGRRSFHCRECDGKRKGER